MATIPFLEDEQSSQSDTHVFPPLFQRYREIKSSTFTRLTFYPYSAVLSFDDFGGNVKPKTQSAVIAVYICSAVKPFEDARLFFRFNTAAKILYTAYCF